MKTITRTAIAIVAIALTAAPALAASARASGDAPIRSGSGSNYRVIGNLEDGERYEIDQCTRQSRWCYVLNDDGPDGWVRGSSLVGAAAKVRATPFEFLVSPFDWDPNFAD